MNPYLLQAQAFCKVTGATGASTANKGCTSARAGAGDYTITLAVPLDELEGICFCALRTASHNYTIVHTSDVAKQVLTTTLAPGAGDCDFDFIALRL